jgi:hypothetical protein
MAMKVRWIEKRLPDIPPPILEFAFPIGDRLLVRTDTGLHCLTLAPQVSIRQVMSAEEIASLDNVFSWGAEQSQRLAWVGERWFFHGAHGGDVTLGELRTGERLETVDPDALVILDTRTGGELLRVDFPLGYRPETHFSIAGFSDDEKRLIVCTQDRLRVFERQAA